MLQIHAMLLWMELLITCFISLLYHIDIILNNLIKLCTLCIYPTHGKGYLIKMY